MEKTFTFIVRYNGNHWITNPHPIRHILQSTKILLNRLIEEELLPPEEYKKQVQLCIKTKNEIIEHIRVINNQQKIQKQASASIPKNALKKDARNYYAYCNRQAGLGNPLPSFSAYLSNYKGKIGRRGVEIC